jgi:hypothetical protein
LAIKKQNLHPDLESQPQTKRLRISFDAFESRSSGYIGPVAALPGNLVAQAGPAEGLIGRVSNWILTQLENMWSYIAALIHPRSALASGVQDDVSSEMGFTTKCYIKFGND